QAAILPAEIGGVAVPPQVVDEGYSQRRNLKSERHGRGVLRGAPQRWTLAPGWRHSTHRTHSGVRQTVAPDWKVKEPGPAAGRNPRSRPLTRSTLTAGAPVAQRILPGAGCGGRQETTGAATRQAKGFTGRPGDGSPRTTPPGPPGRAGTVPRRAT